MDRIFLRDLRVETIIGIYDWERETPQTVSIDLELATDVTRAAQNDDIADALDYKQIAKRLITFVGESRFQLVETLAERIAAILREEFDVAWVKVTVNKGEAIRGASAVGIVIERGQPG